MQTIGELKDYLKSYERIFNSFIDKVDTLNKAEIQIPMIETYRDSFDVVLDELEHISEQKFSSKEKENLLQDYYQSFQEQDPQLLIVNTAAVAILLFFISILSMNLDMHYERSRYPKKVDEIYIKNDEIVKVLPIMMKTITKIIEHYYYVISINKESDPE